jgi:hypothetical protein
MSLETGLTAIDCEGCGWFVLRAAVSVMEAAAVAVEHMARAGHDADDILISPVGSS